MLKPEKFDVEITSADNDLQMFTQFSYAKALRYYANTQQPHEAGNKPKRMYSHVL